MRALLRLVLYVVMNVLLLIAGLIVVRIVVTFFARLGTAAWAIQTVDLTTPLVLPLGLGDISTPYGGVFDVNAGATLLLVLAAEWVTTVGRRLLR